MRTKIIKAPFPWFGQLFPLLYVSMRMNVQQLREYIALRASADSLTGCWSWQKALTKKGYGVMAINGKTHKAHRVAYLAWIGPIPDDMCVLHDCDNARCVNPNHLHLGTRRDNNREMHKRGRNVKGGVYRRDGYLRGSLHPNAKLSDKQVLELRERRKQGKSFSQLAQEFSISISHAYRIVTGRRWAGGGAK